jgi:hypothetical protein
MEHDQIAAFKKSLESELKRLDEQRQVVLANLESLTKMESLYFGNISRPSMPHSPIKVVTTAAVITSVKEISYKTRIKEALLATTGKFARMELYRKTIQDGRGDFSRGTYGWLFAELVKEGTIKELEHSVGNMPGVYCKADEYEELKKESSAYLGIDLLGLSK